MKTKKIVINKCFGGFSISKECAELMEKLGCKVAKAELDDWREEKKWLYYFIKHGKFPKDCPKDKQSWLVYNGEPREPTFYGYGHSENYERDSKYLVQAVEKLGDKAGGRRAKLKVVEIPASIKWHIHEYYGLEHVAEDHQTFY